MELDLLTLVTIHKSTFTSIKKLLNRISISQTFSNRKKPNPFVRGLICLQFYLELNEGNSKKVSKPKLLFRRNVGTDIVGQLELSKSISLLEKMTSYRCLLHLRNCGMKFEYLFTAAV